MRFSTPVQTGPAAHPVNGYQVSFPWVKRLGHGIDHPPPSSTRIKERVEVNLYYSPSQAFIFCFRVNFAFS
jgi:hypothetical protein